jgi:hypothetical protein
MPTKTETTYNLDPASRVLGSFTHLPDDTDSYEVREIWESNNDPAKLVCGCPVFLKNSFCGHILYAVENGLDAIDNNDTAGSVKLNIPSLVSVPIFGSKQARLDATVFCDADTDQAELRKCGVVVSGLSSSANKSFKDRAFAVDFIGFITKGQGRWALRKLVLEYLTEKGSTGDFQQCTAPHHFSGVLTWMRWPEVMRNLYYLLTTDWCYECIVNDGVPDVSND